MQKKLTNICRLILSDKNTRNLFFFLLLNLSFAFVELSYGLWTNSLGLISDSFHMFFDCFALLLGLAASLVTKWRPSEKFTYGFGRAEILAGLANGLFLLFIALFIMKEAIERTFEPPDVHHERLFIISVLGFIVNLIGIFVFQHGGQGHSHAHGGCSHSHSHSHTKTTSNPTQNHTHDHHDHGYSHYSSPTMYSSKNNNHKQQVGIVALDMNGYSTQSVNKSNSTYSDYDNSDSNHHHHLHHDHHHHNHHHPDLQHPHDSIPLVESSANRPKSSGNGQIMQSVLLHIIADTLGSVGVMISALLMNQFGWMIADPICSIFIATLISISVYPLLRDSVYVLMQRIPVELEDKLPSCVQKIQAVPGVLSAHEVHVWTLNSDTYIGTLKLDVAQAADSRYIMHYTKNLLSQIGVDRVHIEINQV